MKLGEGSSATIMLRMRGGTQLYRPKHFLGRQDLVTGGILVVVQMVYCWWGIAPGAGDILVKVGELWVEGLNLRAHWVVGQELI